MNPRFPDIPADTVEAGQGLRQGFRCRWWRWQGAVSQLFRRNADCSPASQVAQPLIIHDHPHPHHPHSEWHGMATYHTYPCQFSEKCSILLLVGTHGGTCWKYITGHWMPGSHHEPKATATGRYVVGCTAGNGQYWTSGWDHRKPAKLRNHNHNFNNQIGRMRAYSCQQLSAYSILKYLEPVMCKDTHAQSRLHFLLVKCGMAVRR